MAWENRQVVRQLAGLESNQLRIVGDWYKVSSNVKEPDCYTFYDKIVDRNGETYGQYSFASNEQVMVTLGGTTTTYWIDFPDPDVMIWSQDIKGERKPVIRWQR
jgi:hypothetical protein